VGNRLTQETLAGTNNYVYDNANRLTEVDGVSYTWSANGNLLSDGESCAGRKISSMRNHIEIYRESPILAFAPDQ